MVSCVPRVSQKPPSWDRLFEAATAQDGYVTTAQATDAAFSSQLIAHYVRTERLVRVHRGVYRLGEHLLGARLRADRDDEPLLLELATATGDGFPSRPGWSSSWWGRSAVPRRAR